MSLIKIHLDLINTVIRLKYFDKAVPRKFKIVLGFSVACLNSLPLKILNL